MEPFSPKLGISFAGGRVQRKEKIAQRNEDTAVMAIGPVGDAARSGETWNRCFPLPKQFARRCIERNHPMRRRSGVENLAHDNGRRLQISARFSGVVLPRHDQIFHVAAIDLGQAGVVVLRVLAAIDGPVRLLCGRTRCCTE